MIDKIFKILCENGMANGDYRWYKRRHMEIAASEIEKLIAREIRDWRQNMGAIHDMYEILLEEAKHDRQDS